MLTWDDYKDSIEWQQLLMDFHNNRLDAGWIKKYYWQFSRNLFPRGNDIFKYQRNIWGYNGYVLALGASGYSHSGSCIYLNKFRVGNYMYCIKNNISPVQRGYFLSAEESIRGYLVLALKHNKEFNKKIFNEFHKYIPKSNLNEYKNVFKSLTELDILEETEDKYIYTDTYINECDRYVRLFYSDTINDAIRKHSSQIISVQKSTNEAFNYVV